MLPSDRGAGTTAEIEEERRLLYVAMTRARDDLHLVVPKRFFTHGQNGQGDRHVYASRTRFVPDELLGLFERVAWPEPEPELAARGASRGGGSISRLACAACGDEDQISLPGQVWSKDEKGADTGRASRINVNQAD